MNIKSFISATVSKVGVQIKYRKPIKVVCIRGEKPVRWLSETTEQIMQFYMSVPPFYDDSVIPALKIAGAWFGDLIDRRKLQMEAIKNNDSNAYGQLLGDLFRSELLSGLWNFSYFKDRKTIDPRFLDDIEDFEIETGRLRETLVSQKPFPGEWGLNCVCVCGGGGVIKYTDPEHGRQANRILMMLDYLNRSDSTVVDIGSGFGGMAKYLVLWSRKPITVILIDIPLNLTTAFAYLMHQLPDYEIILVSDLTELIKSAEIGAKSRLILVPTIYGEAAVNAYGATLLHNAHSFSEMDYVSVQYYLKHFVLAKTDAVIETNSGLEGSTNYGGHVEINTHEIEEILKPNLIPVSRVRERNTRYVTTTYLPR